MTSFLPLALLPSFCRCQLSSKSYRIQNHYFYEMRACLLTHDCHMLCCPLLNYTCSILCLFWSFWGQFEHPNGVSFWCLCKQGCGIIQIRQLDAFNLTCLSSSCHQSEKPCGDSNFLFVWDFYCLQAWPDVAMTMAWWSCHGNRILLINLLCFT